MLFCLGPFISKFCGMATAKRFFVAVIVVFGMTWIGALLLALGSWIDTVQRWMDTLSTDKITPGQASLEIGIGLAVVASAIGWALVPALFSPG